MKLESEVVSPPNRVKAFKPLRILNPPQVIDMNYYEIMKKGFVLMGALPLLAPSSLGMQVSKVPIEPPAQIMHVEIPLLLAQTTYEGNPLVMDPDVDVLDSTVELTQLTGDGNVCVAAYSLTEDMASLNMDGGPLGYDCLDDDVITIEFDLEQDELAVPVGYVLGHEEVTEHESAFVPGFDVNGEHLVAMELAPYMALQNEESDNEAVHVDTATAGDTIAQVHYVNALRQLGNPEARTGGYSSLLFTLLEPLSGEELERAVDELSEYTIEETQHQILIARETEKDTYRLESGTTINHLIDIGFFTENNVVVTDERGVGTFNLDWFGFTARTIFMDTYVNTPLSQQYALRGDFSTYEGRGVLPLEQFGLNRNVSALLIPTGERAPDEARFPLGIPKVIPTNPPPTPQPTPPPLPTPEPTPEPPPTPVPTEKPKCNNGVGNGPDCLPPGLEKNGKGETHDNDDNTKNQPNEPGNPGNKGGAPSGKDNGGGGNGGGNGGGGGKKDN